jgi:hypothetical protein
LFLVEILTSCFLHLVASSATSINSVHRSATSASCFLHLKTQRKMQGKHSHVAQSDLFKTELKQIISEKIDLVKLIHKIDWEEVHAYFGPYYSAFGRASVPTRTMVGLLFLKSMYNVSDEELIPGGYKTLTGNTFVASNIL